MLGKVSPKDLLAVNTIRVLSAEAITKANSGHPGIVLGAAPIGYSLFLNHLNFNPNNPSFDNRDRFVLSAGHGSMLLYSLLHIFGYNVPMSDIETFRQKGSICSGHPEYGLCPGVEISTGPLGQGIANAVGMAIAENKLAAKFNRPGLEIVDHYTYALCGDGCMEEGIENEAASLAGTLKLGKLVVLYDSNNITIEGDTKNVFSENVGKRHQALGWHVQTVKDANDINAISRAIRKAKAVSDKPSLIIVKSKIGYGSPLEGNESCHGAPLSEHDVAKLRQNLNYTYPPFTIPDEVKEITAEYKKRGDKLEADWNKLFNKYEKKFPVLANEYKTWMNGYSLTSRDDDLWAYSKDDATRGYGSTVLNKLADRIPNLMGGSADLGSSNKTIIKKSGDFNALYKDGNNFHFGIREHAMGAIVNGMYVHGGIRPYCSTFFVFSDYMKGAMRMSAIMKLPVIYVMTHDSIGVGEDGCTHQPIEQLTALRATPNTDVYRPADGTETTAAWIHAIASDRPTVLVLSRQKAPMLANSSKDALRGGYVIEKEAGSTPDVILIATGTEVNLAVKAKALLKENGVDARVVSMSCTEVFERQSEEYKESVLPSSVEARVIVEAGSGLGWGKYVGLKGGYVTMDRFGESAPASVLMNEYGFTPENVEKVALNVLGKSEESVPSEEIAETAEPALEEVKADNTKKEENV